MKAVDLSIYRDYQRTEMLCSSDSGHDTVEDPEHDIPKTVGPTVSKVALLAT